jgi:FAD/FMN-containing dehydrogenase
MTTMGRSTVDRAALDEELAGAAHWHGDDGYEAVRRALVWQERKPSRYPGVIVRAANDADVSIAVRWARANGWKVVARSGGHSWAGSSLRDGGMLLDVGGLDEIAIDADAGRAAVGPAVKGRELNLALRAHGLFFPSGHCPSVALGGFLLAGGYGLWSHHYKQACFSVEAIDVVAADGRLIHADEEENSDFLWAARGAGNAFFGVVTRFHLRLYPLPGAIAGTTLAFPRRLMEHVLRWGWNVRTRLSSKVEFSLVPMELPLDQGPAETTPVITAAALAMGRDYRSARAELQPIVECPFASEAVIVQPPAAASIDELYALADQINPSGRRYAVDNMWTSAGVDELLPLFTEAYATLPSRDSYLFWYHWNPQELPDAALDVHAPVWLAAYAVYDDPASDDANQKWVTDLMAKWEKCSEGSQCNDENFAHRFHRPLSDAHLERLETLRRRHDPDGVFHTFPGRPS